MRGDLPLTISVNDKGKAELPDERFENASQVRDVAQQMIKADDRRAMMRERVDALVNGYPTYPKSVTAAKGFGWFPRVNYRESEGLIQAQQTPLFDLISEVDQCIEIDLDIDSANEQDKQDWQNSIAKNWTWLLFKKWRQSFNYHLPLSQREMLVHGMGAHVWPDKNKWIPRTPRSGQILFPEGCSLDFDQDGKYFMLRDFVPGEDVYGFIRNEKASTARGWEVANVWQTLAKAEKQNQKIRNASNTEELQRKARRGDIGYWSTSQVGLWLNWFFVKEYEGGITLYCIEENITSGNKANKDKGFLFRKRFLFKEWKQVLVLFPYDIGNGDMTSVRGLGWRTKDFFELSNRVNNAMAVQVLLAAFPMVKQTQQGLDPEKLKLMRLGALNLLPYGVDPSMVQFPPLNNSGLALQGHLRNTLESNNQSLTGRAPEPKDRETKYSFMLRAHESASVTNGMQSLYESNYQRWQDTMYRRAISTPKGDLPYQKMVEEFRERCRRDSVPDEALTERAIGEIREVTSSGSGSAAMRLQAINTLIGSPVYMNTPESKKIQIERDLVSWAMGGDRVDRYARSQTDSELADPDESFAVQENNGLANGGEALIGDGQNDVTHAKAHLLKSQQIEQMVQQGQMPPPAALDALQRLLAHAEEHLTRLQNNPARKEEFKALMEMYKHCAQYTEQLARQVEAMQEEPSPKQQLSEEGQIGMAKVQLHGELADKKAEADILRKFRKDAFQERLADTKTATSIQRDNIKTASLIQQNRAKTAAAANRNGRSV